jgi:hypothetical protein
MSGGAQQAISQAGDNAAKQAANKAQAAATPAHERLHANDVISPGAQGDVDKKNPVTTVHDATTPNTKFDAAGEEIINSFGAGPTNIIPPTAPNSGLPANVSPKGYTVLLVSEAADFRIVGPIGHSLGVDHQWLAVYEDGGLLGAAGLGNLQGVPGANGQQSPDSPYVTMAYVKDHSNRMGDPGITTQPVYFVDPTSVLSYIRLADVNRNQGPWALGTNDCNTWVRDVIRNSTPQLQQIPQFSTPGSNPAPIYQNVVYPADGSVRQPTTITMPSGGPGG